MKSILFQTVGKLVGVELGIRYDNAAKFGELLFPLGNGTQIPFFAAWAALLFSLLYPGRLHGFQCDALPMFDIDGSNAQYLETVFDCSHTPRPVSAYAGRFLSRFRDVARVYGDGANAFAC